LLTALKLIKAPTPNKFQCKKLMPRKMKKKILVLKKSKITKQCATYPRKMFIRRKTQHMLQTNQKMRTPSIMKGKKPIVLVCRKSKRAKRQQKLPKEETLIIAVTRWM